MPKTEQNKKIIALLRWESERRVFRTMGFAMGTCASLWCLWCFSAGNGRAATIPLLYVILATFALVAIRSKRTEMLSRHLLLLAGALLPFGFQYVLGGLEPSGMVMLWSLPTLVAAVNLQSGYVRYAYLGTIGALLTGFSAIDPGLGEAQIAFSGYGNLLLTFNLAGSMAANFVLADQMLEAQRELRKRVFELQREANEHFVRTLEERNKDMQQSLDYAARIQMALWPDPQRLQGIFNEMHILYHPKEAVGGDFLWHSRVEDRSYFIVLDCTGHGVPGSLMSMLIHGLLNEVVHAEKKLGAADVVRRTQQLLNDRLNRDRTGNTDGAEMAVVCFDHSRGEVSCCSYGCGIIVQDHEETMHLKSHSGNAALMQGARLNELNEHILRVGPETRLFMYTDGVADQFCAKDKRKFSRSRLEAKLTEGAQLSAKEQLAQFEDTFSQWRGDTPLVDDVLLVSATLAPCWRSVSVVEQDRNAA